MKYLLFIISFVLLTSCVTPPPDVFVFKPLEQRLVTEPGTLHMLLSPSPTCMEKIKEPYCGYGVSIMKGREIYIGNNVTNFFGGKSWNQIKSESVYVPAVESYAPLSIYMINACKKANCDQDVNRFKVKFDISEPEKKIGKDSADP